MADTNTNALQAFMEQRVAEAKREYIALPIDEKVSRLRELLRLEGENLVRMSESALGELELDLRFTIESLLRADAKRAAIVEQAPHLTETE